MVFFSLGLRPLMASAQGFTFSDLFGQANKQKQYYQQQLMALQAFESELKQGYGVIQHGLSGIRDINTAELNLHTAYYTSLTLPSAAVRNSSLVSDIMQWQTGMESSWNQRWSGLNPDEADYIASVKAAVMADCSRNLNELQDILTTGTFQMTDDERLKRLTRIHVAMRDNYTFSQSFCNSCKLLALQRAQSIYQTQTLKTLYENP